MTRGVAGVRCARHWSRAVAMCVLSASVACDAGSDDTPPEAAQRPQAPAAAPVRNWTVDTVNAPRFRAYGWATDTLWGIARGRLAGFADSTLTLSNDTVWGVWTAPGHALVAWTNASGAYVRTANGSRRVLTPSDTPPGSDFSPELAWDGTRAVLTWTSEAAPGLSLLSADGATFTHRLLDSRASAGSFASMPALWLDDGRVLMTVVSHRARSGESMPSEGGRRANLGILDIAGDSISIVTDVPDGTFLHPEGLLHADTVLVAVREGNAHAGHHVVYDVRTWTQRPRLDAPGRATACSGYIALLRLASDPASGGELVWDGELHTPDRRVSPLGRYSGFDVRMLWDAACARLAIAQESESRGYVTVVVRQVP